MLKVIAPLVNDRDCPLGLDTAPEFSFRMESDRRNNALQAVQIQICREKDGTGLVWDSGKREAGEPWGVRYDGEALRPHSRYYYRIKAWDAAGEESGWAGGCFGTSFVNGAKWEASWIGAGDEPETKGITPCVYLRREFSVPGRIKCAVLHVTARGVYELELNGKRVGEDRFAPGFTSYHKHLQFQSYDVTELLKEGKNAVLALVGDGWYKGNITSSWHRNYFGERRGFLMELHITLENGETCKVYSDGKFRWSYSPVLQSELYNGEIYDAGKELPGCSLPGFDDSGFLPAAVQKAGNARIHFENGARMRFVRTVKPKRIFKTPAGETVVDMGENMVGTVRLTVRGKAGDRVALKCGEILYQGNFYTDNMELFSLKGERPSIQNLEYILKGEGEETFTPHFTYQGFQYIKILEFPGEPALENFEGLVLSSFAEQTGFFSCSHAGLTKVFDNIIRTQRGTFMDIPIAGPQRPERLGWTGDCQLVSRTVSLNMDTRLFFRKWLLDLRMDQTPDGCVPTQIPRLEFDDEFDEGTCDSSAAWGDAVTVVPWTLYEEYAEQQELAEMYPAMKAYVEYMRAAGDNEFLYQEGFQFGDWFALDNGEDSYPGKTDKNYIAGAYYAYSALLLGNAAQALGIREDAEFYRRLHGRVAQEVKKTYFDASGRLHTPTQTGYVIAVRFGLGTEEEECLWVNELAGMIRENGCHLSTGFIGSAYVWEVLSSHGYTSLVYDILLQEDCPSWLYEIGRGATTVWEHWNGLKPDGSLWEPNMNSFNQLAFGSVGEWFYRGMCGIKPKEPGYRKFTVEPCVDGRISWAQGKIRTGWGDLSSRWELDGRNIKLELQIPAGTEAEVILPAVGNRETAARALQKQGYEMEQGEKPAVKLGSGSYTIVYPAG